MSDELVLMQKDGVELEVHPTTVEAHKAAGWKVVESVPDEPVPVRESKKAAKEKAAKEE